MNPIHFNSQHPMPIKFGKDKIVKLPERKLPHTIKTNKPVGGFKKTGVKAVVKQLWPKVRL